MGMASGNTQKVKFELARNNVIKTLLIVAFFFFICFLGTEIFYLLFNLGFDVNYNGGYYKFTVIMIFLNCTINPFIYLLKYKDFQRALMKQFCCRTSRYDNNSDRTCSTISTSVSEGHM